MMFPVKWAFALNSVVLTVIEMITTAILNMGKSKELLYTL